MQILAVNCGSSSLKVQLCAVQVAQGPLHGVTPLGRGSADGLGRAQGQAGLRVQVPEGDAWEGGLEDADHVRALARLWAELGPRLGPEAGAAPHLDGLAHRVVHGGAASAPLRIGQDALAHLQALEELAPLHNGPALRLLRSLPAPLARVPQVAVFDTAFHQSLPEAAWRYAVPRDLADRHGLRRYGFHGSSCAFVLHRYCELNCSPPERANLIVLHLGAGASATAIRKGRSADTSMGFTPLEGLPMRTRSGDIDPAAVAFLAEKEGWSAAQVVDLLNTRSGLAGLTGGSGDVRSLLEAEAAGDAAAHLALDLFCYRVRKTLGALLAVPGPTEAVVFTAGIGEHAPEIRRRICAGLDWAGIALDAERNADATGITACLSPSGTRLPVWVIPTDEERLIAWEAARVLEGET